MALRRLLFSLSVLLLAGLAPLALAAEPVVPPITPMPSGVLEQASPAEALLNRTSPDPSPAYSTPAAPGDPTRIVYGFDREFPPFSYEDAWGKAAGFDVELMEAIFNGTGAKLAPRPLNWDFIPLELSAGTITLTSGMIRTEQREKLYLFSTQPVFPLQIRLFTKVYNRVPAAAALRGQAVAVEQGSYQHRLLEAFGGINIKPYQGRSAGLRALYNDDVAAYCGPTQNTYYYINKLNYGAITTVGTPLDTTELRIAIARERGDVQRMVDDGLARIIQNGEYDRLYRKWFVRELTEEDRNVLIKTAIGSAVSAYTPYTGNPQGAAVLTATGKVYSACTVENADFSLTISALQAAVTRAVADGEYELRAAVVVTPDGTIAPLSDGDMQTLYEFGRGILILSEPQQGHYETRMIAELLPSPVTRTPAPLDVE